MGIYCTGELQVTSFAFRTVPKFAPKDIERSNGTKSRIEGLIEGGSQ